MKIGEAATQSGLSVKTIRFYESIGLFKGARSENGYRDYASATVRQMHFLQRSRQLGFSLDECRDLLALFQNPSRASKSVKQVATMRLAYIDQQIAHFEHMKITLSGLVAHCPDDDSADCAILDALSDVDSKQA